MKKRILVSLQTTIITAALVLAWVPAVSAAFNANDLIEDSSFDDSGSMNAGQIDTFLNRFAGSCISTNHGFKSPQPIGYTPSGGFKYGSDASAGTVIYDAAHVYGVNPRVVLTTLQKEESLVSANAGCSTLRYTAAMGNDCPDNVTSHNYSGFELYSLHGTPVKSVTGTCVDSAESAGFSRQVVTATWKLAFFRQHAEGNVSWDVQLSNFPNSGNVWNNSDDPGTCYNGYMTPGNRARSDSSNSVCSPTLPYDGCYAISGYTTADPKCKGAAKVYMTNGATAALYYYTPHISGNQNFDNIYNGWFGSPTSPCSATGNLSGVPSGRKVISYQYSGGKATNLAFWQMNNTGSECAELHVWNSGEQSWLAHIATAMPAADPTKQMVIGMNSRDGGADNLLDIVYRGTTGNVELHKMSPGFDLYGGYYDVASNLPAISPTSGTFVAGDFLHRGYDQLAYILYSGKSGNVEVHLFDPTLRKAIGYYDVATDLPAMTASTGTFVAGDFLHRGYDQLAFVKYSGSTGNVEVHLFDPTLRKAIGYYDVATDLPAMTPTDGTFVAGDFLGRGYSQLTYIKYDGSTGHTEVHIFDPSLRRAIGYYDVATNLGAINPNN